MANKRIQKKQGQQVQENKEVVIDLQPEVQEEVTTVNENVQAMKAIETENRGEAHHAAVGVLINALVDLGQTELVDAWLELAKKFGGFDYV
jgi:lipoprotein NlpI